MAWFITDVDPGLQVRVPGRQAIVFRAGEYRTSDSVEVAALRADPRCSEAILKSVADATPEELIRPWAVDLEAGFIHDLARADSRCKIPPSVMAAGAAVEEARPPEGWKVYRRMSDAARWNRGLELCPRCVTEVEG